MRKSKGPVSERVSAISAQHVMKILRVICKSDEPKGVVEVREDISMPASTVHRAIATLEEVNFIQRYRGQPKYLMGQSVQHLSQALFNSFPLRPRIHERLQQDAKSLGLTITLTMRLGWFTLPVAVFEATYSVYHTGRLGRPSLLGHSEAGRLILATLPLEEQARYETFLSRYRTRALELEAVQDQESVHFVLSDASGKGFAALSASAESAVLTNAHGRGLEKSQKWINDLVSDHPELAANPYAHIPNDEIIFERFAG